MIATTGVSLEAHILTGLRKVHKAKVNNPESKYRHSMGPDLIVSGFPEWEARCLLWAQEALITLYSKAARAHGNGANLKLTSLSTAIGSAIIRDIIREGGTISDDIVSQIHIGDYIVGCMVCEDLLEVRRESKMQTSPYVVDILHVKLPEVLLRATTTVAPSPVTTLMDAQGYPYIKRWSGKEKTEEFKRMVQENVPHIQALNRPAWSELGHQPRCS